MLYGFYSTVLSYYIHLTQNACRELSGIMSPEKETQSIAQGYCALVVYTRPWHCSLLMQAKE